jgi:hypothetical protein
MVMRKLFGPKGEKVTEKRRKLHRQELYDSYSSPDVIRIIKSKMIRQARHVTRTGEKTCTQGFG